jgi:hypothetical protein
MSRQQLRLKNRQYLKSIANKQISDGENKIYLLEVYEKPNLMKVGDTHRDVETRNDETITNPALHRKNDIVYWDAVKYDGTKFRDKKLHKFLEGKGWERQLNDNLNKSEWFIGLTLEDFEKEFEEFIGEKPSKQYTLRKGQEYLEGEILQAFDDGFNYVNLSACVRVGKTILSLGISKVKNYFPVYIGKNLTSQSSVEDDNEEFNIVPKFKCISLHGIDEEVENELSKKTKRIIESIELENPDNKKIIFYIDEVDDASHTIKSRQVLVPVVKYFQENGYEVKVVCMSGTRAYRGLKILNDIAIGEKIKEISLTYNEMQILQPETTCQRNFVSITYYSPSEVELTNISDSMKSSTGRKSLAGTVVGLLGTNSFDIKLNPKFPHWFIKFATVGKGNANALVNYLNRNYSVIENQKYFFQNVNGDFTSSRESQDYCKGIIKSHPDCIVVFITQGMATTSFSVVPINNGVVFTDNELTSDDIQCLHRSATHTEGKEWCNLIVVTTNNSKELKFDDVFEEEVSGSGREERSKIYKEILETNCITHYLVEDGKSTTPVKIDNSNVEVMLDKKMENMTKISSIVQSLMDEDELPMFDLLDELVKNRSNKSKTKKGKSVDIFGSSIDSSKKSSKEQNKTTLKKKQKLLRALVENIVKVPSACRMMGISIEEFDSWNEIGTLQEDMFLEYYNNFPILKDRVNQIYGLCEDENYLVKNYINKMV